MKRRRTPAKKRGDKPQIDQHPLIFPNTLRHVFRTLKTDGKVRHNVQIRVPIDDTTTQVYVVYFEPSETERTPSDQNTPFEFFPLRDEYGEYRLDQVLAQDAMAWETQGAITDRTQEHLGVSDEGIIAFRKLLREQIEIVRAGGEPLGIIRTPERNGIIEFDVINERIGLYGKEQQKVA
jgi:5,5'-dehydrodivanillate O-demethylase